MTGRQSGSPQTVPMISGVDGQVSIPVSALKEMRRLSKELITLLDRATVGPPTKMPADSPEYQLLDLPLAAESVGMKPDTLRHWCRNTGKYPGLGRKRAGRWQVNIKRLRELRA